VSKLDQYRLSGAFVLYAISLALPGLHLVDGNIVEGWRLLLTAWYGFLVLEFAWLANPLFLFGILQGYRNRPLSAGVCGVLACLVGLLSYSSEIWIANHTRISGLGTGFYVWMTAFVLLASCLLPTLLSTRGQQDPPHEEDDGDASVGG